MKIYQLHPYQKKLVSQARSELAAGKKSVLIVSPAGSGKSVVIAEIARLVAAKGGNVMFTVHSKELVNQITQSFINNSVDMSHATIMTVGKIVNRLDILPRPALIITDETHHSLAKTYRKIYDYYADVPRIGFTATPWRLSGQGLDEVYESMIEGPTVSWLIENHFLAPFDYYAPKLIDTSQLKKSSTGDYTNKSMDKVVKPTIYGDVIKYYRQLADGKQAIVYAHNIKASQAVVEQFNDAGITAVHADSKTPAVERDQIMTDFKAGKITVLSNVDLYGEGVDVPDVSVVIMLRPTASLVLDVQQSMRGMRFKKGKKAIIIDHVNNVAKFGLPDAPRQWSLKARKKNNSGNSNQGPPVRECPKCFGVFFGAPTVCPLCGNVFTTKPHVINRDKTAKLKKITQFTMVTDYIFKKDVDDLHTMDELKRYRCQHGYKPGWTYMQAKRKGILH